MSLSHGSFRISFYLWESRLRRGMQNMNYELGMILFLVS